MCSLFALRELSDVFVDACLRDESGRLLFLSCYGRDTALQQLFAAFSLPASSGGFDQLRLLGEDGRTHQATIRQPEALKKLAGRLPKQNLFGNLAQVWIFDVALNSPDRANRIGWVVIDPEDSQALTRMTTLVWAMVETLSPVPLMSHWREPVLQALSDSVLYVRDSAFVPLGRIDAVRVHVPDTFPETVSRLVRAGAIGIDTQVNALSA